MEKIIDAIDRKLLKSELSNEKLIRNTQRSNNQIFSITYHNSPNVMLEIGRLREISYRQTKSGTGKKCDIDSLDTAEKVYNQLIVWDPNAEEIIGGYRYIICRNAALDENKVPQIGTARLFNFSENFIENFIPYTIELGRSFVQPQYQSTKNIRKSLYALDNLWDGLGALVVIYPEMKYFLGQVSIYTHINKLARDLIVFFLRKYFPDNDKLVEAINPVSLHNKEEKIAAYFTGKDLKSNMSILSHEVRALKERVPPLINTYINTSPSMKTFGTVHNPFFDNMEDTGILISIKDIYESKKDRYIKTFRNSY
ncbi:MAG: GNAT family N-acetyltransferase [Bacteroidota bacterium]|nr:GNAT family N-acetyltransferase [Bacteroidota bacterium]